MKLKLPMLLKSILIILLLISSSQFAQTDGVLYSLNSSAQTISKLDLETNEITKDLLTVGSVTNRIYTFEGMIYVVNSTPDNVMVIDPNNDTEVKSIIALEEGSNPWSMAFINSTKAYVTGQKANSVYVIDLTSGTVTKNIAVGTAPQGIKIVGDKAYVSNTGLNPDYSYGQSSVSVIDTNTDEVLNTVDVPTNAQDLALAPDGSLHVVCTGNYYSVWGSVAVLDISSDTPSVTDTINIGGSPGDIEITNDGYGFLSAWGDTTGGFLYKYNAIENSVTNNSENPILVGKNLSGLTYVSEFNTLWLPYMAYWGGDGFAQKFSVEADSVIWTSPVIGNGTSDFAYLAEEFTSVEEITSDVVPTEYKLSQNYPNPFNPSTTIEFAVPNNATSVQLKVYDILGNEVAELVNEVKSVGSYRVKFDASNLSSGIYFYQLNAGNFTATKRMMLVK